MSMAQALALLGALVGIVGVALEASFSVPGILAVAVLASP